MTARAFEARRRVLAGAGAGAAVNPFLDELRRALIGGAGRADETDGVFHDVIADRQIGSTAFCSSMISRASRTL